MAMLFVVLVGVPLAVLALVFDAGRRRQLGRAKRVIEEMSVAAARTSATRDRGGKGVAA